MNHFENQRTETSLIAVFKVIAFLSGIILGAGTIVAVICLVRFFFEAAWDDEVKSLYKSRMQKKKMKLTEKEKLSILNAAY